MIIKAIVCLGFGPLLLFFPGWLLNLLGTTYGPGAGATLTANAYGATLFGTVLLTWYFAHPQSQYFSVGKITKEQVADYAERKGMSISEAEKWLAANLDY